MRFLTHTRGGIVSRIAERHERRGTIHAEDPQGTVEKETFSGGRWIVGSTIKVEEIVRNKVTTRRGRIARQKNKD